MIKLFERYAGHSLQSGSSLSAEALEDLLTDLGLQTLSQGTQKKLDLFRDVHNTEAQLSYFDWQEFMCVLAISQYNGNSGSGSAPPDYHKTLECFLASVFDSQVSS